MRICIVSQEYPPETGGGGIGTQCYLKATGLSARGHHVEVVTISCTNPRVERDGNLTVHRMLPTDFGIKSFDDSMQWMQNSLNAERKLQELDAENNFDIIQFPEYGGEGFFHQTNNWQYRKARYSVQLHGPLAMFAEHMGWPEKDSAFCKVGCFMEKMSIHHADGLLASSHATAKFCASVYDFPVERVNVIHSGIDTNRFSPREPVKEDWFPKILFVGNLAGNKGFNLLVATVIRMRAKFPRIKMKMMGRGDESTVKAAKKRVEEAGAQENIEIGAYVPYLELPQQYAWCDFFAGPSVYEPGPGNVYLEAMSSGRPVIACNTAGAPEVVHDEQTGLLIPPQDSAALERTITRLAEDSALRKRLGEAGRQWVVENVSIEKYLDKVETFYERLLS
jgi:glycosyltransferase involved in cell wall biosynthesis